MLIARCIAVRDPWLSHPGMIATSLRLVYNQCKRGIIALTQLQLRTYAMNPWQGNATLERRRQRGRMITKA